jgi:MFS family permease
MFKVTDIHKIYALGFFDMFLVIIPVVVPYFLSLGLSMEEIFQLQAVFGLAVAVMEVPSGYLCDLWGRKRTLCLGTFCGGIGFSLLWIADSYWSLLVYQLVLALSASLVSGTDISILYDLLKERNQQNRLSFTKTVANRQLATVSGESVASIVGGFLAVISWHAVILFQIVFGWFPFVISLTLREPHYKKMDHTNHAGNFRKIIKHIFFSDRLLTLIFINLVLWGLATFIAVWIFQKHWHLGNIDLAYFGLIWAVYNVTVGIMGQLSGWLEQKLGAVPLIAALGLLPIVGYFGLAWFSSWLGVAFGLLFQLSRGITQVILREALNWRVPSEFRATANSLSSLFFRLGFAIIGPFVGYLIDKVGLSSTAMYLGYLFLVVFFLALIPLMNAVSRLNIESIPNS